MADLDNLSAAQTVKIAGAGPTGVETNFIAANSRGELENVLSGQLSTTNSTTSILGIDATFTGAFEEVLDYSMVSVNVFADKVSAVNGLKLQFSSDGVNVNHQEMHTVPINEGVHYTIPISAKYFRIQYVNGNLAQTTFRLQTIHHKVGIKTEMRLLGASGAHFADVELVDGNPSLRTFGIQAIESLRGFDPIADTWFYIGTENNSTGAGAAGDTVRVQIAAGDDPTDYPAIDLTYTLISADAGDEEVLATNIAAFLNANGTFSLLWRAQRIANSGVIYISAKKPGSHFERPNVDDFIVTSTGTTIVTRAFDKIIRQNKVTSLARDPADPRQGILGIQGSVIASEGDVTSRFQTVFGNLLVDGSTTPVNFRVEADAQEVKFITSITFGARGNGIQFGKFLSQAGTGLTNGVLLSFKSNDFAANRQPLKTTDDMLDYLAEDPGGFALFVQPGGDKLTAVLKFTVPLEIRPNGEFVVNDFLQISVRDNLTSGIIQLRAIVSGFSRAF